MTYRLSMIGTIALALLLVASFVPMAHAQSTVSGTLTAGSNGTSSNSVSGNVGTSSNSLSGTVVSTSTNSGGGGGGGSSGGSSAGGGGFIDVCTNLDGLQITVPTGYVLSGANCVVNTGTVLGAQTEIPNVPNTGAGGNALLAVLMLLLSAAVALGGGAYVGYEILGKRYH